jgi:hypothetical protein
MAKARWSTLKASHRLTIAPSAALGRNSGSTTSGGPKRDAHRNTTGVIGDECSETTPGIQGNIPTFFTNSPPIGIRLVGRFWSLESEDGDDDEKLSTLIREELIAATSQEGFSMDELTHADKELQDASMVGFSSPTSFEFRCPLATKIVKAVSHSGSLKHCVKPWQGPLPKSRVSPPKNSR